MMDRRSFLKTTGAVPAIAVIPRQDPIDAEKPIWFGTRFVEPGKEPTLEWLEYGEVRMQYLPDRLRIKLTNKSSVPLVMNIYLIIDGKKGLHEFAAAPRTERVYERVGKVIADGGAYPMFMDDDVVDTPPQADRIGRKKNQFLVSN